MNWRELTYLGLARDAVLAFQQRRMSCLCSSVLMYHDIAGDNVDIEAWTVVRESDFLRQIEYLDRHYELVSLDQAITRTSGTTCSERPMAVVTFDDGGYGNSSVLLPIIESLKVPVTIYVATGQVIDAISPWFDQVINAVQTEHPVTLDLRQHGLGVYAINRTRGSKNWVQIQRLLHDLKVLVPSKRADVVGTVLEQLQTEPHRGNARVKPMSIDEVKQLSACPYVTLGAHSHCHSILTQLSVCDAEESVRKSKALVEQWTGRTADHFAYPNGSYNDELTAVIGRAGFRSAVTTEPRTWDRGDSLLRIPRIGVGRYDSMAKFKVQLVGGTRGLLPWRRR
jgi:peptidoglycan/xylan/chitin deacetylase (PgdA/CDA1 family)